MPIAEPSGVGGLWPAVRQLTGWIESDEDAVQLLANDWRGAGGSFAAAGGYPLNQFASLWTDGVGGSYLDLTRGNLATAAASADHMVSLAQKADRFAGEIIHVKNAINAIIDANRQTYADLGAIPLVGGAAQTVFATLVAGLVNQLIDESAGRVATQGGGNAPIRQPPPPDASPEENAAYWNSLTDDERRRLAQEQPELVGSRDGFSAEHRDLANRILLAREKNALVAEQNRLLQQLIDNPDDAPPQAPRLAEINAELRDIAAIESRGGDFLLLGFNTNGPGRDATAILARGNPDTAANVATYIPGTEWGLDQMDRLLDDTTAMHTSANREGGAESSVILWLGYDAPDNLLRATETRYAQDAVAPLARFQDGLRASHLGATPSHNSLVGHSYGSTVAGYTAKATPGLAVDDVIAVGSPGLGVEHASELDIPENRVWVLENNKDIVADTGVHGKDPDAADFGARVVASDPAGRIPISMWNHDLLDAVEPHMRYFRADAYPDGTPNPAYDNLGDLIAGRPPSRP